MNSFAIRSIFSLLLVSSFLEVSSQGFYKPVVTAAYGISNHLAVHEKACHFGDSTILVAFEFADRHSTRFSRFFGTYSSDGDLRNWHSIPNSSNGEYQKLTVYDSLYIQYRRPYFDSSIVSAIDHSGNIIWSESINAVLDPYAFSVAKPERFFVLDKEGFYAYVDFKNGTRQNIWKADSTHQVIQSNLGLDSIIALKRIGQVDTAVYFLAQVDDAGTYKNWLLHFKPSCNCWRLAQDVDGFELTALQESAPLLFHQSAVALSGDSIRNSLSVLNVKRDTLWSQQRREESFLRLDSTPTNQQYTLTRNEDGFYLFERSHSRWSDDSFLANQYQLGIKYWVLDSAFLPVLETTIWPNDAVGKVVDQFYSYNGALEGSSNFKVSQSGILSTCINRDQRGLGEPMPILFQTGPDGYTFLHQSAMSQKLALPIKLYPNPAEDHIFMETGIDEALSYKIFNNIGQTLRSGAFVQKARIDLKGLNGGIYFIAAFKGAERIAARSFLVTR